MNKKQQKVIEETIQKYKSKIEKLQKLKMQVESNTIQEMYGTIINIYQHNILDLKTIFFMGETTEDNIDDIKDRRQLKIDFIRNNNISLVSKLDKTIIKKYIKYVGLSNKTYWRDAARTLRLFIKKNNSDLWMQR